MHAFSRQPCAKNVRSWVWGILKDLPRDEIIAPVEPDRRRFFRTRHLAEGETIAVAHPAIARVHPRAVDVRLRTVRRARVLPHHQILPLAGRDVRRALAALMRR